LTRLSSSPKQVTLSPATAPKQSK